MRENLVVSYYLLEVLTIMFDHDGTSLSFPVGRRVFWMKSLVSLNHYILISVYLRPTIVTMD